MKATKKNTATTNDLSVMIQAEIAKALASMNQAPTAPAPKKIEKLAPRGKESAKMPAIKASAPVTVTTGEYKGHKTITLIRGEKSFNNQGFTFGMGKAEMIIEALDAIKAFIEANHE